MIDEGMSDINSYVYVDKINGRKIPNIIHRMSKIENISHDWIINDIDGTDDRILDMLNTIYSYGGLIILEDVKFREDFDMLITNFMDSDIVYFLDDDNHINMNFVMSQPYNGIWIKIIEFIKNNPGSLNRGTYTKYIFDEFIFTSNEIIKFVYISKLFYVNKNIEIMNTGISYVKNNDSYLFFSMTILLILLLIIYIITALL